MSDYDCILVMLVELSRNGSLELAQLVVSLPELSV